MGVGIVTKSIPLGFLFDYTILTPLSPKSYSNYECPDIRC